MAAINMKKNNLNEKIRWWRPDGLAGLEILEAENCAHLWKVYHKTYTLCQIWDFKKGNFNTWRYRGQKLQSSGGGFMLMEPGETHVTESLSGPGDFWALLIDPSHFQDWYDWGLLRSEPLLRMEKVNGIFPDLWAAMQCLHAVLKEPSSQLEKESSLAAVKRLLVEQHCETDSRQLPSPGSAALLRAKEYVRAHYKEEISLRKLAEVACVCPEHMDRIFKNYFGTTPSRYQKMLQVEEVKRLIRLSTPITRICEDVNFCNPQHLNRVFRNFTRVSPSAYRDGRFYKP